MALLRAYAKKLEDAAFMQGPVGDSTESWIYDAVLLTATAAAEAREELSQQDPAKREFWGNMIVNRILRGVLSTIHNENAPGSNPLAENRDISDDRTLECSLSSKWLYDGEIVYIS